MYCVPELNFKHCDVCILSLVSRILKFNLMHYIKCLLILGSVVPLYTAMLHVNQLGS